MRTATGLPNDTWYELKGSEYGKEETIRDYAVTYYRPSAPKMNVAWTDNRGGSGVIEYLEAFHQQDYYYPAWVEADSYTLRGPLPQIAQLRRFGQRYLLGESCIRLGICR